MTPIQEQAIREAKKELAPYFDSFVIVTRSSSETGNGDHINSDWHGSLSDVMGLARITALRFDRLAMRLGGDAEIS